MEAKAPRLDLACEDNSRATAVSGVDEELATAKHAHLKTLRDIRSTAEEFIRSHPTQFRSASEASNVAIAALKYEREILTDSRPVGPSNNALALLARMMGMEAPAGSTITIAAQIKTPEKQDVPTAPRRATINASGSVK